MLMPKSNVIAILTYLFKEGALVAKKDMSKEKHELIDVPNLHVVKLMISMKSRGYIRETFNWQWYYYYLTDEGVAYLQKFLGLSEDIKPGTHKGMPQRALAALGPRGERGERGDRPFGRGRGGDREGREGGRGGYRRGGGFGRGAGAEGAPAAPAAETTA